MITNELSDGELEELLLPFFRLRPQEERHRVMKEVLQYDFDSYSDLCRPKRRRFRYDGFDLTFHVSDNDIYLSLTKSCLFPQWFGFRGPVRKFIDICKTNIAGLQFQRLDVRASFPSQRNPWFNEMAPFTLYIDPRNVDMNEVKKDPLKYSSPTTICFFVRTDIAHVELCFRPSGYRLSQGMTIPV